MNPFEQFNREFFGDARGPLGDRPRFFDKAVIFDLGRRTRVEIILDCSGYADRYSGYIVRVVGTTCGEVTRYGFRFSRELSRRTDGRADYDNAVGFHASPSGRKVTWYIARPHADEVQAMAVKMVAFAAEFAEREPPAPDRQDAQG